MHVSSKCLKRKDSNQPLFSSLDDISSSYLEGTLSRHRQSDDQQDAANDNHGDLFGLALIVLSRGDATRTSYAIRCSSNRCATRRTVWPAGLSPRHRPLRLHMAPIRDDLQDSNRPASEEVWGPASSTRPIMSNSSPQRYVQQVRSYPESQRRCLCV